MVLRKYLSENIEIYGESTYSGVFKLSDHVDIEIRRLRERDSMFHKLLGTGDNIVALHKEAEKLGNELNSARMEIAETRRNSEKLQMQMVAILGIFAAIVMAFSGGLDILGGAISVSGESDLFRVTFIVLLCGIILFNIFAFLMYMILAIIDSPNRLYSDRYRGAKGDRAERITSWLNGFKGSRFVIAFNIVLMASLIIDLIAMTVARRQIPVKPLPDLSNNQYFRIARFDPSGRIILFRMSVDHLCSHSEYGISSRHRHWN